MKNIIDKIIVFTLCFVCCIQYEYNLYIIIPVICAVSASALMSYLEKDIANIMLFTAYCIAAIFIPSFIFFLPLICYDIFLSRRQYFLLIGLVPVAAGFKGFPVLTSVLILLFIVLTYFIKYRTVSVEKIRVDYIALRDSAKELSLHLERQNRELMEKQDYEVNLATLNERNRIARDIHDSVGHILSNSILQTGALIATCKDDAMKERLNTLKTTLSEGMNSIRSSIHDLHDESIDLHTEVSSLVRGFQFCGISLEYDIGSNPDKKIKYALIAVIKEALSNIIKHSDAKTVNVSLREHPAFYQLLVKDDGSKKGTSGDGIGLKNIEQRVKGLGGTVNIGYGNGFFVFVSIPKEK
jgi:signal transduction histidine kinase